MTKQKVNHYEVYTRDIPVRGTAVHADEGRMANTPQYRIPET